MARADDFRNRRLRRFIVRDVEGIVHEIEAHYCFNNDDDGRGLVLRRRLNDDSSERTEVVATFAKGYWTFYKEITDE